MIIDEIISFIKDLPLKEALIYLTTQGITGWATKGYEKIKEIIINKQNEGKYAFVPNKEEVLFLEQAEKSPSYQQILSIVPNYRYIDLIRTGLLLEEYNRKINIGIEPEKNKSQISKIKVDIIRRPGGGRFLKIVKLPASNFFPIILSYLYQLKIHGYPENQLEEEFNELIDEWEKCTKFVSNEDLDDEIFNFCKRMVTENNPRFFILALYEDNIKVVESVLEKIHSENIIQNDCYLIKIEKQGSINITPRIEVMFYKNPSIL